MRIEQYEDKNLSHYSYLIEDNGEMVIIDPSRNPLPYLDAARSFEAHVIGIVLTHRHADFVSGHTELHQTTGATVYIHESYHQPTFAHQAITEGFTLQVGSLKLSIMHTPGHTPDSICVLVTQEDATQVALFTGDTLFIGDCGRPDLFDYKSDGALIERRKHASKLFHSLQKIKALEESIFIFPGHGAGSLCGKNIANDDRSTIGEEKRTNWSLKIAKEDDFVEKLTHDLPYIPQYFAYNQILNSKGTAAYQESIERITFLRNINSEDDLSLINDEYIIVDTRAPEDYKKARLENSINIPNGKHFETWLGTIIKPNTLFYLAGDDRDILKELIERTAKIGYEAFIEHALFIDYGVLASPKTRVNNIIDKPLEYTIVDVRTKNEVQEKTFPNIINIPLEHLESRISEIPTDKPIVVHCAGGYRSAIASSLLERHFKDTPVVFDIGGAIKEIIEDKQ